MKRTDLFRSLVIQGVSKDDALAYAKWLDTQKPGDISRMAHPVQFAYLNEKGNSLKADFKLKKDRLGDIWGIQVDGIFWCRWHTDTLTCKELKMWNTGQIMSVSELDRDAQTSEYERIRWKDFYDCIGTENLKCYMPSVSHFLRLMPYIEQFSAMLRELEKNGQCVQDWFNGEDYWAFDPRRKDVVVFDIKTGTTKPVDVNERYATRPIWLPRGIY